MAENYEISLGIGLDNSDFSNIQNQIKSLENDPVKIKLDTKDADNKIDNLKKQLQDLGNTKGKNKQLNLFDTTSLEKSLNKVSNLIEGINRSIGRLDSKKGTSIVTTINHIEKSLQSATKEFTQLNKSMQALSGKDLKFDFNLKAGGSNPIKAMTEYGIQAKTVTIPALKEQIGYFEQLFGGTEKAENALKNYLRTKKKSLTAGDEVTRLSTVGDGFSLDGEKAPSDSARMVALKQLIDLYRELTVAKKGASAVDAFDSKYEFADTLIKDTVKLQDGTKQATDQVEELGKKLKGVFGGGIDADSLSAQLKPIVENLGNIKKAIDGLSPNNSIDGLTASFNRLSDVLDKLDANFDKIKSSTKSISVDNAVKTAQYTGQQIGEAISDGVKQNLDIDNVIDKEVKRLMKLYGVKGKDAFNDIRQSLVNYKNESKSNANDVSVDENGFLSFNGSLNDDDIFGASGIRQVTSAIADNRSEVIKLDAAYEDLLKDIKAVNDSKGTTKVRLSDMRSEWGDDYKNNKKLLGSWFSDKYSDGIGIDSWVKDKSWSYLLDLDTSHQDIANQLIDLVAKAKAQTKKVSGDELFKIGSLNMDDMESEIMASINTINAAEQKMAQSSTQSANTIVQNQQRIRQSYEDTLAKQKQRVSEIDNEIADYTNRIANPTRLDPNVDPFQQIESYQNSIDTLEREKVEILANIEKIESTFKKNENVLNSFKKSLSNIGMGADEIDEVAKKISNLGVQIETLNQKKSARTINTKDGVVEKEVLDVDISGVDEYGNAIKLTQQYDMATADLIKSIEKVSTVQQKAGKSTDTFAKQQKTAVSNLTNQINQVNRAAVDQNANRPIKEAGHLDTLANKYDEITLAIQRMENASSDTFVDEQNNVRRLVSEFKSLVKEYKNAENVSTKMKGTDFASGLDIAKNDLEKFKAQAKDFPQITRTIENLDRAIEGIGDSASLNKFNDQLRVARSELAKIKSETTATNRNEKVGINVSGLESKIADLQRISPEIDKFETEIDGAKVSVQSLLKDLGQVKTQGDFSVVNSRFKAFTDSAKAAGISVKETTSETKTDLDRLKELATQMGNLEIEIFKLDENSNANEIVVLEGQLKKLRNTYDNLIDSFNVNNPNLKIGELQDLDKIFERTENKIAQLNARMTDTSAMERQNQVAKETRKSYQELLEMAEKISNLETKIEGFKISGKGDNQIEVLENELKSLQNTYESLMNTFATNINNTNLDIGDFAKLQATLDSSKTKIEELKAKAADARAELAKKNELNIELGTYDNQLSQMYDKLDRLSGGTKELRESIEQVENAYSEMNNALKGTGDEVADRERLVQAEKEYAAALEKTNNLIKIQSRAEAKDARNQRLIDDREVFQAKIDAWLTKNSAATKKFGAQLLDLRAKAETADRVELNHLEKELQKVDKAADKAGLKMMSVGDKIKSKAKEYMAYFSVAEIFMEVTQAMKNMFEQVKLIDSAMTELKKVTDESDATYDKFLTNAASRAKDIGTTIDGLVSSTADFARLGYGFEDAQGLAEVANIYAVVGDEIEGVEGATQSLISTMAAFKDSTNNMSDSDFAMSIIDRFNEIGNNFSISSGGIGEALERSASSLKAANATIDESIALITASNQVVQDPEAVGTAWKTISMRIRGAKTEMEDLGLDTEGMVESTSKLREEILALSGVDIMLDEDTFKSPYKIMDELAKKWKDLSDIQQASLTELIAGKRQGNIVSSLMNNFDVARDALETSLNSSGSAMREHEKWQQSLESRILSLKSSWQGLSQAFLSSDFLKVALNGIIGLADGVTKLIDTFGVLPTLIGTFAGGLSLFKNQGLFKFEKDTKSIKLFGTQLTDLKGKYTQIHTAIDRYNSLSSKSASFQATYNKNLANSTSSIGKYLSGLKGANASMGGYIASLVGAKITSFALQAATMALNMALTMGISALISWGISKLDEWIETSDELAERIDEVTTKYKEQHKAMMKIKGDYNTSNEDSLISKYGELSKGVDSLGKNVSLTADEYEEYRSIVSTIADQMPSLVTGYNSQGDAILNCSGSVDKLAESYRNLIKEQNSEVLKTGSDIFKDYKNDLKETTAYFRDAVKGEDGYADYIDTYNTKHFDTLKELNNLSGDELEKAVSNLSYDEYYRISQLLEERGLKRDVIGTGDWGYETYQEHIINAIEKDKGKIKSVLAEASADLDAYAEDLGSVTESYFSTAFLGGDDTYGVGDYSHLSEKMQGIITRITSSLDSDFYTPFLNEENPYEALSTYFNDMLIAFDNLGSGEKKELEAAFDLQTQFNGGKISYGEYVKGIQDAEKIIGSLGLDEEVESQLKLSLNTDEITDNYEALTKRLVDVSTKDLKELGHFSGASDAVKMATEDAKKFLDSLTASEYAVAVDLLINGDIDLNNFNIDSLRKYIEDQARLNDAMNFTIAMDVETTSIEEVNTAMAESVSAAGLSSESIKALRGRYAELAEQGYDLSSMFEETSNGIHLNRNAVDEFERTLASNKLSETEGHLTTLKGRYDELTEEIKNCTDAGERASLYNEQQEVVQKINDLATLASQYEGLTSAYNAWQNAESAGNERDMYENVLSGFETVKDELSRGWADDSTIKFLELITGRTDLAGKSAKELKEIWNGLDDTIKNTSYSVKDFFTADKDGNSTSKGVYNFLDAVGQLEEEKFGGKDAVKRDKDGNIISFDFKVAGGDEAIAEALGISEELVQIMLRAADDAGFVVTIDGEWTQLADLKTSAEESENALKKLKTNGLDALKDFDDSDLDFNFDANSLESLNGELEKAMNVLDKFRNKDGTVNMKMEGAEEALEIASYFTATIDKLTEPVYMQLETNQVEENLQEPLTKMQEFERLSKEKHQLKLTGDTKELEKVEKEMNEIVDYIYENDDLKAKLEIEGLSKEEIKSKLEKGEIEIPATATVDIQMEMSEDIKDMRLLMMRELSLVSEEEVKLKVGYEIDDSLVDKLDDEEKEVVIKYIEENEDAWNKLSEDERKIFIDLVASGVDLETLTDDETKEVVIEFATENKNELDKLTDEEKEVVVDIVADESALKALEEHGVEIEAFAHIFGVEEVDDLKARLEGLDDEQILVVAEVIGNIQVEELRTAMSMLEDEEVEAIATAIGTGDVEALKTAMGNLDDEEILAVAKAFGYDDVNSLKGAMDNLTDEHIQAIAQALGIEDVDDLKAAVDRLKDKDVEAVANVSGKSDVDGLKSSINNLQGKTVTVWAQIKQKASSLWSKLTGGGGVDGTAHVDGTAFANGTIKKSGRAFKQGDWGTKDSGVALGGEEAPELLVRNGRWHLIGEKGAEFFGYRKGDIKISVHI